MQLSKKSLLPEPNLSVLSVRLISLRQLRGACGNLNFKSSDERMMENGVEASDDDEFINAFSFKPSSELDTCGFERDPGYPPVSVPIVSCAAVSYPGQKFIGGNSIRPSRYETYALTYCSDCRELILSPNERS